MNAIVRNRMYWYRGMVEQALQRQLAKYYRHVIRKRADWQALDNALYIDALETTLYLTYHPDVVDDDAKTDTIVSAVPFEVTGVMLPARHHYTRWWSFIDALETIALEHDIRIVLVPCGMVLCQRKYTFSTGQIRSN